VIRLDADGGLFTVTLGRPEKRNALTRGMLTDLVAAVDRAAAEAKALVITGAGPVFSAGADLAEVRQGLDTDPLWEELSGRIAALPFPTLAALNGSVAGGGFGMILACDIRISVPEATLFWPVISNGLRPRPSDPQRLAALVGPARARMMLLTGERIGAEEARVFGLVDRIVPGGELLGEAARLLAAALAAAPEHVAALKRAVP
jgi:enoyl-CoA hydratase/carnithine racemase